MSDLQTNPLSQPSKQEIISQINRLKNRNDFLTKENQLLENYLKRVEPNEAPQVAKKMSNQLKSNSPNIEISSLLSKKKTRATRVSVEVLQLSIEQKCDIASNELEVLAQQKDNTKEEFDKKMNTQEASIVETQMALVELKKSKHEYDRLINQGAINKHTGKH